jgi:hypothetical protein
VLGIWGLPDTVVEGVAHQHHVDRLVGPGLDVPLAVHVGAALAGALIPGAVAAGAGRVDLRTLESAGLADRMPAWRALAAAEAARA